MNFIAECAVVQADSRRRPVLVPTEFHVEFTVDKVVLGQVFS